MHWCLNYYECMQIASGVSFIKFQYFDSVSRNVIEANTMCPKSEFFDRRVLFEFKWVFYSPLFFQNPFIIKTSSSKQTLPLIFKSAVLAGLSSLNPCDNVMLFVVKLHSRRMPKQRRLLFTKIVINSFSELSPIIWTCMTTYCLVEVIYVWLCKTLRQHTVVTVCRLESLLDFGSLTGLP